jgi:hypothetical protein
MLKSLFATIKKSQNRETKMTVENIMKKCGFVSSSSGGGCLWYTKPTNYEGKEAYIAITVEDGGEIPETLDEPILVGIYSMETADLIVEPYRINSLKSYLGTV